MNSFLGLDIPVKQSLLWAPPADDFYWALCLREPYLALIIERLKQLETRTRCLRKAGGPVVLCSSQQLDQGAWDNPQVGGLLSFGARAAAMRELGQFRCSVLFADARRGTADDSEAAVHPAAGKWVWPIPQVHRFAQTAPVVRLRPDGSTHPGASQGFFRVPRAVIDPLVHA